MRKPSALTAAHSAILSGGNLTESWKSKIDGGQLKTARRLLEKFELAHLYSA